MKATEKCKQLIRKIRNKIISAIPQEPERAQVVDENGIQEAVSVNYVVKTGDWVKKQSESMEKEYVRCQGRTIDSASIREKVSLAASSRAKDAFLEQCLLSGTYTEENLLVVTNPYQLSPLTALVLFQTKEPYKVRAEVPGAGETSVETGDTSVSGMTALTTKHRIPVIGLYPDKENAVSLQMFDEENRLCRTITICIKTKPLPEGLKNMVEIREHGKVSAFGLTFVYGGDTRFPYAFDRKGELRFYIARQPKPYGLHFLSDGHFLFAEKTILMPSFANPHSSQILEMDLLGRVHRIYHVENGLHHDASEMTPGGNIIAAGSSLDHSNEDMVIELDRKTGKVVKQVKLGDVFDKTYQDGIDWVHLNTVSYYPEDNSVLICCRNLHTVAKLDWGTGELKWMICNPKFWKNTTMTDKLLKPVGHNLKKEGWFYQAHAAYLLDEDFDGNPDTKHMIIYDNHWHKRRSVSYFDEDPNSFVRIYTVNEKEGTVALWKSFACAKSKIRSNGILCHDENCVFAMSGFLEPPLDGFSGMINEYDFDSGKLKNQYLTKASFYRAYELPMNFADLEKSMEQDTEYMLGTIRTPYETQMLETAHAKPLPKKDIFYSQEKAYYKGTKAERKRQYQEAMESGDAPFDIEQDIANTEFEIFENILYVKAVDHLIKKIYFVGEKKCFVQDYGDTKQTNPGLFARMLYSTTVPLGGLDAGEYRVYLECEEGLYDAGENIVMK